MGGKRLPQNCQQWCPAGKRLTILQLHLVWRTMCMPHQGFNIELSHMTFVNPMVEGGGFHDTPQDAEKHILEKWLLCDFWDLKEYGRSSSVVYIIWSYHIIVIYCVRYALENKLLRRLNLSRSACWFCVRTSGGLYHLYSHSCQLSQKIQDIHGFSSFQPCPTRMLWKPGCLTIAYTCVYT